MSTQLPKATAVDGNNDGVTSTSETDTSTQNTTEKVEDVIPEVPAAESDTTATTATTTTTATSSQADTSAVNDPNQCPDFSTVKFNYPQTPEGKFEEGVRIKELAALFFKHNKYSEAASLWATSIAYLKGLGGNDELERNMAMALGKAQPTSQPSSEFAAKVEQQLRFLNSNLALAYLKLKRWEKGLQFCDKALHPDETDPSNVKVLLRKAELLIGLGNIHKASTVLQQVDGKAPAKSVAKLRKKLAAKEKKAKKKQQKTWGGIFNKK